MSVPPVPPAPPAAPAAPAARCLSAAALLVLAPVLALSSQVPVRIGQTVTGRLTVADAQFSDSSRYKMYVFVGNKGDTLTTDLASDDFDANLILADASGNVLTKNDDAGGNCNARVIYVIPQAANYRLYANSSAPFELGAYRLTIAKGRGTVPADTTCRGLGRVGGMIQVGQIVNGRLSDQDPRLPADSTYYERWVLPIEANQAFTVDLESDDFDAYVILTNGRGQKLAENDDGGGGCNARLVYTASDDHPLRVVVNTAGKLQTGRFTLRVSDGESPTEPKGNCRFRAGTPPAAAAPAAASAGMRQIRVGQTVTEELTSADSLYPDTTYYQLWQFTTVPGRDITIDLASDDFDPLLIIRGADLSESIINDDGGPGCAARVSRQFPGGGPYTILVNTTSTPHRQTGRFTLSITEGHKDLITGAGDCQPPGAGGGAAPAAAEVGGGGRSIAVGQALQGELSTSDVLRRADSTYAQRWTIDGTTGQVVTIDLESDAFDGYLFLSGPGIENNLQDDDSGGNCNARLTATFPQSGAYTIVVNSSDKYATGKFSLSVTAGSKPKSLARCSRTR